MTRLLLIVGAMDVAFRSDASTNDPVTNAPLVNGINCELLTSFRIPIFSSEG
jgi:hypothetical protein